MYVAVVPGFIHSSRIASLPTSIKNAASSSQTNKLHEIGEIDVSKLEPVNLVVKIKKSGQIYQVISKQADNHEIISLYLSLCLLLFFTVSSFVFCMFRSSLENWQL